MLVTDSCTHPGKTNVQTLGMSDSRFNQIAGGMPPEAKHRCIVDMIHGDQLIIVNLANGPPSLKEGV